MGGTGGGEVGAVAAGVEDGRSPWTKEYNRPLKKLEKAREQIAPEPPGKNAALPTP